MQHAQSEYQPVVRPNIGTAYGKVIRQTESPREIEHRVLSQITADMELASGSKLPGPRAQAVGRNRELWQILRWSVIDDNNGLPVALRANIASLGLWVDKECSRVLRENASLDQLIDINRIIMRGLATATAGA